MIPHQTNMLSYQSIDLSIYSAFSSGETSEVPSPLGSKPRNPTCFTSCHVAFVAPGQERIVFLIALQLVGGIVDPDEQE